MKYNLYRSGEAVFRGGRARRLVAARWTGRHREGRAAAVSRAILPPQMCAFNFSPSDHEPPQVATPGRVRSRREPKTFRFRRFSGYVLDFATNFCFRIAAFVLIAVSNNRKKKNKVLVNKVCLFIG